MRLLHEGRFDLRGTLGTGGAGVVYRAFDRQRGREVAIKVLRHASGRDLYRFKREFRALAELFHPNLVALHELFASDDEWYFTMELVEGKSFIDWVRPTIADDDPTEVTPIPELASSADAAGSRARAAIVAAHVDLGRLRATLIQLVDALIALHAAGKLHRDLKPSNVVVTDDGRAVLLDFGLVVDRDERNPERLAVGTPVYMSPEQAADQPLTAASDWYSLGAMVYEALTGRRPFEGPAEQVMRRKQNELPARPSEIAAGVPRDLDDLCLALLAPVATARPHGRDVLERLGARPSASTHDIARQWRRGSLIGRAREIAVLQAALADCRRRGVAVFVTGETGIGKSALIRRFLDDVADGVVVLEGRCYQRETVPYKMLDTVVDSLATHLAGMEPTVVGSLLPRELPSLARLFPVLRRVPRIAELAATAAPPPDPLELRQRAFGALRFVLGKLARWRTTIVFVDDVHWGDADSAVFLADAIHHPEPSLMFVFAHAEDDAGVIRQIRRGDARPSQARGADLRELVVGPLGDADARALVGELAPGTTADHVVAQAHGVPLILTELAHATDMTRGATIDDVIAARASRLPNEAQSLLVVTSVAGKPLPLDVAATAAGITGGDTEAATLAAERLVRVRRIDGAAQIEPAHDHVQRAVVAALDRTAMAGWHEALARAFAPRPDGIEAAVAHYLAAERPADAAIHAVPAAHAAEQALAFRRAAELYAVALEHGEWDDARRCELLRQRAHALTCGGQLDEAAASYGDAAALASGDAASELIRLQVEQLLRRGRLDDGLAVADKLLARVGLKLSLAGVGAVTRRSSQRAALKTRGLDFGERVASPDELRRVDVLYSLASGLAHVDPQLGRVTQNELLRAALDAGDPFRVCLALAQELGYLATGGARTWREVEQVGTKLKSVAARVGHPHVIGVTDTSIGIAAFLGGRFREARGYLEAGLATLRDWGTGVRWEIDVAEHYLISALYYLGQLRDVARLVPALLRDAVERGDTFAQLALRAWRPNIAYLIADRPADARAFAVIADDTSFHLTRWFEILSHAQIDLYAGDGAAAWARVDGGWAQLEKSRLLRLQEVKIEAHALRARSAIAASRDLTGKPRADLLRVAHAAGDDLINESAAWGVGLGHLVRGLAGAASGAATASDDLERAERTLGKADMVAWCLAAKVRRSDLEPGPRGMARALGARDELRELGVANPDAFLRMMAPVTDH